MKTAFRLTLMLAGLLAIAALLIASTAGAEDHERRQITVTGLGEVLAEPDMATVSLGVVSEAKTASEALSQNSETMAGLIAELKAEGIAARDLQTSDFSVQPNYVYPDRNRGEAGEPRITGYIVRNMLTVRIRELTKTGAILDRMVSSGSNAVNGIVFTIAEPRPVEDRARQAAVADARAKAELYAAAAGVKLGNIVQISELAAPGPVPVDIRMRAQTMEAAAPVEAGELSYRAQINIVWEISE